MTVFMLMSSASAIYLLSIPRTSRRSTSHVADDALLVARNVERVDSCRQPVLLRCDENDDFVAASGEKAVVFGENLRRNEEMEKFAILGQVAEIPVHAHLRHRNYAFENGFQPDVHQGVAVYNRDFRFHDGAKIQKRL